MIFKRLFRPRLDHNDPAVRCRALNELAADHPDRLRLAGEDPAAEVRLSALSAIDDLACLLSCLDKEQDDDCRRTLLDRLIDHDGLQTENIERLAAALKGEEGQHCLQNSRNGALRSHLLVQVDNSALMLQLVREDASIEVRLAAVARIEDAAELHVIAKEARKRDKRLSKAARERAEALDLAQAQRESRQALCEVMETLAQSDAISNDAAQFQTVSQQWQGVAEGGEAEIVARYNKAFETVVERREQNAARRGERLAILEKLEILRDRLNEAERFDDELNGELEAASKILLPGWEQAEPLIDPSEAQRLQRRWDEAQKRIEERERLIRRHQERSEEFEAVLRDLEEAKGLDRKALESFQKRWTALTRLEDEAAMGRLQQRFNERHQQILSSLDRRLEKRREQMQSAEDDLRQLDEALSLGELKQAIHLRDHIQKLIGDGDLSEDEQRRLRGRLQKMAGRLQELQDWRRWGGSQAREQLCDEAESLLENGEEPEAQANNIRELRKRWKSLDRSAGLAPDALWERFDAACSKAWEPCEVWFQQQAEQRKDNRVQRDGIVQQLEALVADTDWENPDWQLLQQTLRDTRTQWQEAGQVDRSERKFLDKRFWDQHRALEQKLKAERDREKQRREALIEDLRTLAQGDDLGAAINAAKQAQSEWNPTLRMNRKAEQVLWQSFREVCDQVFAQRDQERDEARQVRETNQAEAETVCSALEALQQSEDISAIRKALKQAEAEFAAVGEIPKDKRKGVERRYQAACEAAEQRIAQLQRRGELAGLDALLARADLCARREAGDLDLEAAKVQWEALPAIAKAHEAALLARLEAEGGDDQKLQQAQELCLELEIAADVESPAQYTEARMALKVSRLSDAMSGAYDQSSVPELLARWCACGPLPTQDWPALRERVAGIRTALES